MRTYLALARKSTDKQEISIDYQLRIIREHPVTTPMECLGEYADVGSGRIVLGRNELGRAFRYCRDNPGMVDYIYCQKWDRLGRNLGDTATLIEQFRSIGVEVNAVEQLVDFSDSSASAFTLLGLYLGMAHDESNKIGRRTKDALYHLKLQGYWTHGRVPIGYLKQVDPANNRKLLLPDPQWSAKIAECFNMYASGRYGKSYLRKKFNFPVSHSNFYAAFDRIVYAGMIEVPAYNGYPAQTVVGIHKGIITLETFDRMKQVSDNQTRGKSIVINDQQRRRYYLKGHLICAHTGEVMTASGSKGRKKYYHYYFAPSGKGQRIPIAEAHETLANALTELRLTAQDITAIRAQAKAKIAKQEKGLREDIAKATLRVQKAKAKLDNIKHMLGAGDIDVSEYRELKSSFQPELEAAGALKENLRENYARIDKSFLELVEKLASLDTLFEAADFHKKDRILTAIFPRGFEVENGILRTTYIDPLLSSLLSKTGSYEHIKIKEQPNDTTTPLVGPKVETFRTSSLLLALAG